MKYEIKRSEDCEVILSHASVYSSCLGTRKTNTDIMISIIHDNGISNEKVRGYENKGYIDVFMTMEQAYLLKIALEERLKEFVDPREKAIYIPDLDNL